jgi:hypothetical protein
VLGQKLHECLRAPSMCPLCCPLNGTLAVDPVGSHFFGSNAPGKRVMMLTGSPFSLACPVLWGAVRKP